MLLKQIPTLEESTHAVRELPQGPQGTTASTTPPFVRAGYDCRNNTTVGSRPETAGWAPLVCAGLLTTSLRGLWVSGLLPPGNGGTNEGAATQEPTKQRRGLTHNSRAGNPKRTRENCHNKEVLSNQRLLQQRNKWSKSRGEITHAKLQKVSSEDRRTTFLCTGCEPEYRDAVCVGFLRNSTVNLWRFTSERSTERGSLFPFFVLATEARENPITSRHSRESHGETRLTEHALNDVVGKVPVRSCRECHRKT